MTKRSLISLIVFLSVTVCAVAQKPIRKGTTPIDVTRKTAPQARYSLEQLAGKWQETKRFSGKQAVPFKDSLQLKFEKNTVDIRDGVNLNQFGAASIDAPNMLQAAGDSYEIISLNASLLVINDGEFTRHLYKTDVFYYETLGKIILPEEKLDTPVIISLQQLKGKWMVYRRQAEPSFMNDTIWLIKSIEITQINADGITGSGTISFYKTDISETLPCTIRCENGSIAISTTRNKWTMDTYKADDKSFVFGKKGQLVYYAKHL